MLNGYDHYFVSQISQIPDEIFFPLSDAVIWSLPFPDTSRICLGAGFSHTTDRPRYHLFMRQPWAMRVCKHYIDTETGNDPILFPMHSAQPQSHRQFEDRMVQKQVCPSRVREEFSRSCSTQHLRQKIFPLVVQPVSGGSLNGLR